MLQNITGDVPNPNELYLWIGGGAQAFGVLMVAFLGSRLRKEDRSHMVPAIFVNLFATCSYFAMASGQLDFLVGGNREAQLPRYFDWLATTPLLLLSLLVIALPGINHHSRSRERTSIVASVLGVQAFLILAGIFATISGSGGVKWTWFIISSATQLVLYWLLFVEVRSRSKAYGGTKHTAVYTRMVTFLSAWWALYPIEWAIGPQGARAWGESADALIFTVLDIVAKVVFNGILLSTLVKLGRDVHHAEGVPTVELLAGTDRTEELLDEHALADGAHFEPAPGGGRVLTGAGFGDGAGSTRRT